MYRSDIDQLNNLNHDVKFKGFRWIRSLCELRVKEMAKLHSYYTLCPLIDQQNLLGVERDSESGCAIVTLGRNIVIRYKLQDPKQLSSWTTKDRLTTQVIYDDSTEKYAAVFNEKKIRLWTAEQSDLNYVSGYKFQYPLRTILTLEGFPPVIVRSDGATASLEWALGNRKSWSDKGILKSNEKIFDCGLISIEDQISLYILIAVDGTYDCIVVNLDEETYRGKVEHVRRFRFEPTSEETVGHAVMRSKTGVYLLTLRSHGRLYAHSLTETSSEMSSSKLIGIIGNVDTRHPVVMTPLDEATVAIYGADISEEGAILMIYDVQFKLVQAAQKLKLYTEDAKLWRIEDKLLLAANRHLAIAPYHLAPQRIAALLGSSLRFEGNNIVKRNDADDYENDSDTDNDNDNDDDDVIVIRESTIAEWEKKSEPNLDERAITSTSNFPGKISDLILSYVNEGLSDAAIQERLIPRLIESKNISAIIWCLDTLKDLPEKLLIDLLAFSLRNSEETFSFSSSKDCATEHALSPTEPVRSRRDFLNKIFSLSYSDVSLSSYLKTGLSFDEILRLLRFLICELDHRETSLDNILQQPTDKQLYEWSNLLLDSHYQHYVLSRDSEIAELLDELNSILENHLRFFRDLANLRPILNRTVDGKSPKLTPKNHNEIYTIEEIKLY